MGKTIGIGIIGLGSVSEKYVSNIRQVNLAGVPCEMVIACDSVAAVPDQAREHAYHVLEIMTKSFESARTGQALPILSSFSPVRFDAEDQPSVSPQLDHAPS